jgi:hypothetical protein
MPSIKPRNITPQLRRLTVSAQELASLGWLHGTVGRLRSGLGMRFAYQTGEFTMPSGRLDTASLQIEQQWPKELIKFGVAVAVAAAMIVTLALAGQNPEQPEPTAAAAAAFDGEDLPQAPEPVPLIAEEEDSGEPPSLVKPRKVKKTRKRHKKRRSKKRRRRR